MQLSFLVFIQSADSLPAGSTEMEPPDDISLALILGLIPVILSFSFIIFVIYRSRREAEVRRKETELKLSKAEGELKALRAQINPHFIFNCLNSIQHFILSNDSGQASEYLIKFSKLIRYVLESSAKNWVSLEEELEANRIYLELEKLRTGDGFTYEISLDKSLFAERVYIPPMLIQPFLENSVWHGIKEKGEIRLQFIREDTHHLLCEIQDQGSGSQEKNDYDLSKHVKKSSMGISLMEQRFRTLNELRGTHAKFEFANLQNGGKSVRINLPFEEELD